MTDWKIDERRDRKSERLADRHEIQIVDVEDILREINVNKQKMLENKPSTNENHML